MSAGTAAGLLGVAQALLLALVLAALITGEAAGLDQAGVMLAVAGLVLVFAARAGLGWLQDRWALRASQTIQTALRRRALDHVIALGPVPLAGRPAGAIATVLVDQIDALDGYFARYAPQMRVMRLVVPALVGAALVADWRVGLGFLAAVILVPLAMAGVGAGTKAASERQFHSLALMGGYFLDRLNGLASLRLFGQARAEQDRIAAVADRFRRRTMAVLRLAFLSSTALELFAVVTIAGTTTYVVAAGIGTPGGLTATTALFLVLMAPELFQPLRQFTAHYHDQKTALGAAEAILDLLETPAAPAPAAPMPVSPGAQRRSPPAILFDGLRVAYQDDRGDVLRGLSLRIEPGQRVALTGPSGAGKSTVLAAVLGLVPARAGTVRFETADGAQPGPGFAWIGQRPVLFRGSVADNIRLARPGADARSVHLAAERAGVMDFAAALPHGLDTPIGDGGFGLSGGEAQRVALARAFLSDAPVLIMDEPTAHLDGATEDRLLAAFDGLATGRTTLVATHNPRVAGRCDRILALDGGLVAGDRRPDAAHQAAE